MSRTRKKMKQLGVQLYSFHELDLTLFEKIKLAGSLGFDSVEFAGGYQDIPVEALQQCLEEAGVRAVSAHVGMAGAYDDLAYLAKLGVKFVYIPAEPFCNLKEVADFAAELNQLGAACAKHGMKAGFHNHTCEFSVEEGRYLLDELIALTDPELVSFELDCGWCSAAGVDPVAYIQSHAGRFSAIHIKENNAVIGAEPATSRENPVPRWNTTVDENGQTVYPPEFYEHQALCDSLDVAQGSGIIDWKAVQTVAQQQCADTLYIVEREADYEGKDRVTCLKEDVKWLQAHLS